MLAMGNVRFSSLSLIYGPLLTCSRHLLTNLLALPIDPVPDRVDNHHRTPEDPALLRSKTESQRNRSLFRRAGSYPPTMATDWVLC